MSITYGQHTEKFHVWPFFAWFERIHDEVVSIIKQFELMDISNKTTI